MWPDQKVWICLLSHFFISTIYVFLQSTHENLRLLLFSFVLLLICTIWAPRELRRLFSDLLCIHSRVPGGQKGTQSMLLNGCKLYTHDTFLISFSTLLNLYFLPHSYWEVPCHTLLQGMEKQKRATEDEMVGWHHRCNGHELGQTPGDGEG